MVSWTELLKNRLIWLLLVWKSREMKGVEELRKKEKWLGEEEGGFGFELVMEKVKLVEKEKGELGI